MRRRTRDLGGYKRTSQKGEQTKRLGYPRRINNLVLWLNQCLEVNIPMGTFEDQRSREQVIGQRKGAPSTKSADHSNNVQPENLGRVELRMFSDRSASAALVPRVRMRISPVWHECGGVASISWGVCALLEMACVEKKTIL